VRLFYDTWYRFGRPPGVGEARPELVELVSIRADAKASSSIGRAARDLLPSQARRPVDGAACRFGLRRRYSSPRASACMTAPVRVVISSFA
jgi:hypothetical protein